MLNAAQIRAARALLNWGQERLAKEAQVSRPTIKRMEGAKGPGRSAAATVEAVRAALESSGVEFLSEDDTAGPGVRLSKVAAKLLFRTADPINRAVTFRIRLDGREYDCNLRASVLDGLDGKIPGYETAAEIEAAFDRNLLTVLDRARRVVVGGLAVGGALTLWPEDFPELR